MKLKSLIRAYGGKSMRAPGEVTVETVPAAPPNPLFDAAQFRMPSYGRALDEIANGKMVVFGLPKCGNVWMVSMFADYLGVPPIDPMVDVEKKGVGMCHLPLRNVEHRLDFIQAVYLMRDIRDLVVSYYHNCQTAWFKDNMPNFHYDDIESFYFEWFLPRVVPFHEVDEHARKFSVAGVPVVRYERLCADTVTEFERIVKRLGFPLDHARIRSVVEKNSLDALKKSGRQLNVFVPTTHFRRGGAGGYKEELPPTVLRHINSRFAHLLVDWGYELDALTPGNLFGGAPA